MPQQGNHIVVRATLQANNFTSVLVCDTLHAFYVYITIYFALELAEFVRHPDFLQARVMLCRAFHLTGCNSAHFWVAC